MEKLFILQNKRQIILRNTFLYTEIKQVKPRINMVYTFGHGGKLIKNDHQLLL